MSRRTNPWPAFVDLFSALLVVTFAGFILMTSGFKKPGTGVAKPGDQPGSYTQEVTRLRAEADRILKELQKNLAQNKMRTRIGDCGEDTCLDLYIQFPLDEDEIPADQQQQVEALQEACVSLREALARFPPEQMRDIEIIVEGHTDRTQASGTDPRGVYLYNWGLSSRRAAAILWEFRRCDLQAPTYSIAAIGYADSKRLCDEATPECDRRNRRTTLRLRANTQKISERLAAATKN